MIHLLIDYYIPPLKERQIELDSCYLNNMNNPSFDKIHLFCQNDPPQVNEKTIINTLQDRNTYFDYFQYAKNNIPEGDIVVLSNSDMYFDNTINKASFFDLDKYVLVLTRWASPGLKMGIE